VFDPTYSGKAKIFGWWGRLEDEVPLALLHSGTRAATFASGLRPPAAESWSLGTQVELPPVVAGFRYSERRLISAVAVLDDGARPMVVNPGEGAAANGQPATRFERTVTLSVSHPFWDLWTLDASARLQWVRANVLAASLLEAGPLHEPVEVWLPEVKVSAGRGFPLGPSCTLQLGASVAVWRVPPGSERFITVPGDLDFADRIDFRIGMSIRAWREGWVQLTAEGFDLFDSGRRRSQLEGRSVRFGLEVGF
jgi:hypothetical protein